MTLKQSDNRFGPQSHTPAARMRVKLIAAASITTGIVVGLAVSAGASPFQFLHPNVATHLAGSTKAPTAMNAAALFPVPVGPPAAQVRYAAYVPAPVAKAIRQPVTQDDNQRVPAGQGGGGNNRGDDN